jgi:uncharacterized protein (TIGR03382 family)
VVTVASLMPSGQLDPMSHFGKESVALAAPGADLCSLGAQSDTDTLTASGTSYATPVVAATAALVREAWPRLSAVEVAEALQRSCVPQDNLTEKVRCGGALSAERALQVPFLELLDVSYAPDATLRLALDSRASGGEVLVVLLHGPEMALSEEGATPFESGDSLPIPEIAPLVQGPGTWLIAPLPEDGPFQLDLALSSSESGDFSVLLVPFHDEIVGPPTGPDAFSLGPAPEEDPDEDPEETAEKSPQKERPAAGGCGCGGGWGVPGALPWLLAWLQGRRELRQPIVRLLRSPRPRRPRQPILPAP